MAQDHDDHHGHQHGKPEGNGHPAEQGRGHAGHSHGEGAGERQLLIALVLTTGYMVAEVIGGLIAHSLALIADAGHMLADAVSLAMSYAAIRVARQASTEVLTYGHHRWQVLAAFVNGLALLALSVWIVAEAAQRLFSPVVVHAPTMIWVGGLGVLVSLLAYFVLSGGERNLNVRSALLHVASDVLGNFAAAIAGVVILLSGWTPIDPILSAFMALLIVRGGWRITRESAHILLEGAPSGFNLERVKQDLLSTVPAVTAIHHVHVWSLTEARLVMTLHAVLTPDADGDKTVALITETLRKSANISHATVQIEREPCGTGHGQHSC